MAIHISRGDEWKAVQKALNLPEDLKCRDYDFSQRSGEVTEISFTFILNCEQVHLLNKLLSEVNYKNDIQP